jgi:putative ABC transport system permease protein
MFSIQSILLNRVVPSASGNQSNTILFDIQPSQKDSVVALAKQQGLPIHGTVPIVNMRLEKVNDITLENCSKTVY